MSNLETKQNKISRWFSCIFTHGSGSDQRPKWDFIVGRFCQSPALACHNSRILTTANHHHQSTTTNRISQFANASQNLVTVLLPLDRSRQLHVPVISRSHCLHYLCLSSSLSVRFASLPRKKFSAQPVMHLLCK